MPAMSSQPPRRRPTATLLAALAAIVCAAAAPPSEAPKTDAPPTDAPPTDAPPPDAPAPDRPEANAAGPAIRINIPSQLQLAKACAKDAATGASRDAKISLAQETVTFPCLLPGQRYDITLTTADGGEYRGVDLALPALATDGEDGAAGADGIGGIGDPPAADPTAGETNDPDKPNTGKPTPGKPAPGKPTPDKPMPEKPMPDEDRAAVLEIIEKVPAFYSRSELLALRGNATRATALVQLIRDTDFHARQGDEIIWRVEVWQFENQAGGWAKLQQQNRVLTRERFPTRTAFDKRQATLHFDPRLGGILVPDDGVAEIDWAPPKPEAPSGGS